MTQEWNGKEALKTLSSLGGISGFEYTIVNTIRQLLSPYCDELQTDNLGNLIGIRRCGIPGAKCVMLDAHMDGIGLMVKDIDERGFLSFVPIGGVDTRILPACEVTVHGKKELYGVIGAKPPHLQAPEDAGKPAKIEDMAIDVGLPADEVRALVAVGDMISFRNGLTQLDGEVMSGKYMDDRAGIISVLECLHLLKNVQLTYDVAVLIAVQEEVGLRGAKVGAYHINPDWAIVVDVGHGDTPDATGDNVFPIGGGTVLSVGPNLHPELVKLARETAARNNIEYKIEVDGGDTGTDAWEVQIARSGVPTLLLSIPLRYMHTTVETLDYRDVLSTARLMKEIISALSDSEAAEA